MSNRSTELSWLATEFDVKSKQIMKIKHDPSSKEYHR
jgi:hypothetical protein